MTAAPMPINDKSCFGRAEADGGETVWGLNSEEREPAVVWLGVDARLEGRIHRKILRSSRQLVG